MSRRVAQRCVWSCITNRLLRLASEDPTCFSGMTTTARQKTTSSANTLQVHLFSNSWLIWLYWPVLVSRWLQLFMFPPNREIAGTCSIPQRHADRWLSYNCNMTQTSPNIFHTFWLLYSSLKQFLYTDALPSPELPEEPNYPSQNRTGQTTFYPQPPGQSLNHHFKNICICLLAMNLVYVIIPTIPLLLLLLTVMGVCCFKMLITRWGWL